MKKLITFLLGIFLLFTLSNCQTIKQKTDEVVKKENKKLSQFIGQPVSELKIVIGKTTSLSKSETGSKLLIYKTKKYGIPCEGNLKLTITIW